MFYCLAFPKISAADLAWIQAVRQEHDPQFALVDPHFTLVFGTEVDEAQLRTHVQTCLQSFPGFKFVLRSALVVKDSFSPNYQVFLLPDEGLSELVKLHDGLYTAVLAPALRLDIPYIPHITIAASPDVQKMKQLADDLNKQSFSIAGRVEEITLVKFKDAQLEKTAVFPLQPF